MLHFKSRARPNVLLACCTKALVMYGVCFSCYLQRIKRGWIQPVSLGGDFSDILQSSLITGSLLWEKWSILHNTAVTKQWTAKWPYISNAIFRLVQMMVKRVAFVGLKEGDPPPWIRPWFQMQLQGICCYLIVYAKWLQRTPITSSVFMNNSGATQLSQYWRGNFVCKGITV